MVRLKRTDLRLDVRNLYLGESNASFFGEACDRSAIMPFDARNMLLRAELGTCNRRNTFDGSSRGLLWGASRLTFRPWYTPRRYAQEKKKHRRSAFVFATEIVYEEDDASLIHLCVRACSPCLVAMQCGSFAIRKTASVVQCNLPTEVFYPASLS